MYIERVVLKDVKGFRELDFDFARPDGSFAGWTVLTGDNGSGKTALLKAIALAVVGPEIGRALLPSLRGWVRDGAAFGEIAVQIVPSDKDQFSAGRRPERFFWSELELTKNGGPEISLRPGSRRRGKQRGPINGPWAENTAGWFIAGYGPFRRLYGASPEAQRIMSGPSRVARFATMFKEDATLLECELWLRDLNYKALENKDRPERKTLDQVLSLLNDDFLPNGIRVHEVNSDGLWLIDSRGAIVPLEDMSDGYRAALALMIDILRHLHAVFPGLPLVERLREPLPFPHSVGEFAEGNKERVLVPHAGVVLIDEVDAHLHPEWQRRIGFWLRERFPRIQFIVTSHSPLVAQAADVDGIYHLPAPGSQGGSPRRLGRDEYWRIVSSRPDTILLSEAFGLTQTRSDFAVEARRGFARLKAKMNQRSLTQEEQLQLDFFTQVVEHGDD